MRERPKLDLGLTAYDELFKDDKEIREGSGIPRRLLQDSMTTTSQQRIWPREMKAFFEARIYPRTPLSEDLKIIKQKYTRWKNKS